MVFKELDLEKLQEMSHLTIEQAVDAVFWVDESGHFYRVNEAASKLSGYTKEELLSMSVIDFASAVTSVKTMKKLFEDASRQKTYQFEDTVKRKDGTPLSVSVTMNYIEFEGQRFSCTFVRDISDIKAAMEEIRQLKDRLQKENIYLQEEIGVEHNFSEIIGSSTVFKKMLTQIEQVAATDANVLILGETGTGKELVARAVHKLSGRSNRPLVKVNCAALPANLIESELFGHEKGAFTGALGKKIGRFELADGGTIFLDEIGDLPLELQAKLLRVLQEGEFERLGSSKTLKVNVRVVSATNRHLEESIKLGEFREDLYYRLNVFPIQCPPLRERREDIPYLVKHFISKYSAKIGKTIETVPKKVMQTLQSYHWPGNVRELENIIERTLVVSQGTSLELGDWFQPADRAGAEPEMPTLAELEKQHILKALDLTTWRVSGSGGAAERLGLKPTTLEARMKKLGIVRKK